MTLSLAIARKVAAEACEAAGVELITPDSPSIVRSAVYLATAARTSLTADEARARVSIYVPQLAVDVRALLTLAAPGAVPASLLARPAVVIGDGVWSPPGTDDASGAGAVLAGVVGHELSHALRDRATRDVCGVVCSVLWATAYLAHPAVQLWEEGTCKTSDVTADVILHGRKPDDAYERAMIGLRGPLYSDDARARVIAQDAVRSAVMSLRAGQLPGADTAMHDVLRRCRKHGADLGAWNAVVDAA